LKNKITIAESQAIMEEQKITVRPMEWQNKPQRSLPQWLEFYSACQIKSEIQEDLMFRAQYRGTKQIIKGLSTINYDEIFNVAICIGEHRILALDYTTTKHTNKIGIGRPFYKKSFSEPHLHIWTSDGYGYAEPCNLKDNRLEFIMHHFSVIANLEIFGGFIHPLKGKQLELQI
jgi:hypothetical protein